MSGLRVVHCIYDDPSNPWVGGGGAHRVREIYRRLAGRVEATVVAGAYPGARPGVREGVRYRYAGLSRPYALSRLSYGVSASRMLRRGAYDVAVFDFSVYTPIRVPAGRPVGHVVHMLMGPTARERWGRVVGAAVAARERRMLAGASHVSVTSEWLAAGLQSLAPSAAVHRVGSGVDASFYGVERSPSDYVLFYGRFDLFQKGLDVLLDAAPSFLSGGGVRLVLVGRGKDAEAVRRRAASLGVERVEVREDPTRGEVLALLAGALVLVHPSRFEGYPVIPAEAMAAGVPVVATRVGAVEEVVGPAAGVLVEPGDARALAGAVGGLLGDPEWRERIGRAGRSRAAAFSWDAVAERHLEFLHALRPGGGAGT